MTILYILILSCTINVCVVPIQYYARVSYVPASRLSSPRVLRYMRILELSILVYLNIIINTYIHR